MNEKLGITQERVKQLINAYCEGSQQRFADRCGISKFSVSQYVNGSNSPGNVTAAKIGKAFGIDPLWVMGFDVPMVAEKIPGEQMIGPEQEENPYYLNDETREIAQFLFEHPEHKILFDASRKLQPEDVYFILQMISKMNNE